MTEIVTITTDPLVGSDGTHIYDGQVARLGIDELTITTNVADDGLSFTRTTGHGDQVISQGVVTKDGYSAAHLPLVAAALELPEDDPAVLAALDAAWEKEKATEAHAKEYINAVDTNGDLTSVERTVRVINWTQR